MSAAIFVRIMAKNRAITVQGIPVTVSYEDLDVDFYKIWTKYYLDKNVKHKLVYDIKEITNFAYYAGYNIAAVYRLSPY